MRSDAYCETLMHILQMLPALEVGGVERGVLDIARGLIARGHRVSVVSSGGPLAVQLTETGAAHHQLPVHEKSPITMWSCIPAVERIIRETGVDIVHARSRVSGWIGFAAARSTQRPFITTAHGFYRPHFGSRVMVWGRSVIAPSEALGRYLVDRFKLSKRRLRVIPRGVDVETFRLQPSSPHIGRWRIGMFGRLSAIKGHDVALRACERLMKRGIPITLCIAGDQPGSPMRRVLESLIIALRLEDAVEWCGVRQDIPALIASSDLILAPSTYPEAFGRSVVEAQAVGRPVIASRLGGHEELIKDGETGLLVPPGDHEALATAVERFMNDVDLRERCVAAGRQQVEREFTVDRMVERTAAVYDECLTKPNVLIWKLSALGDVVLSTPSLRAIRRQFPNGNVTLVTGRSAYDVVARCPHLNDIIIAGGRTGLRGLQRQWTLLGRIRDGAFDLSIDLQNNRMTHLMAWLAGIPIRVGYRRKFGRLLNRAVRLPRVVLAPIAHQHYLLGEAGIQPDGDALELWPSKAEAQRATQLLKADRTSDTQTVVGIHPGGSGRWKTKRWGLDRWARVCDALTHRNVLVVVVGGPEEALLGEELLRLTTTPPLVVIGQTTLMELACLIQRCDVFLAHDSSSLHLAAAVGTPTVALFGPTDARRHLPPSFIGQVIAKKVFCSPCYSPRCRTITHACMKQIGVDEVLSAVTALLPD